MFASKMCAGAIGSWCATHDSTQVTISGSPGIAAAVTGLASKT
jgi:hypothetical protein